MEKTDKEASQTFSQQLWEYLWFLSLPIQWMQIKGQKITTFLLSLQNILFFYELNPENLNLKQKTW